jgi:putative PIN family toxin of toxin-antitoxin system
VKVVADTNTVISGLIWYGSPRQVIEAARSRKITLYVSDALLVELRSVLGRPKLAHFLLQNGTTADELFAEYISYTTQVLAAPLPTPVSVDPDDDAVLACAVAAQAVAIVTGDHHLLDLRIFQGIPILTASELLARIGSPT